MPELLLLAEIMTVETTVLVDRCGVLRQSYREVGRAS